MDCVQVIAGMTPHILEQQALQRSNSERMEALQAEVHRLGKQAQDAKKRYIPSSCFLFSHQGAVLPFAVVTPEDQQPWCSFSCDGCACLSSEWAHVPHYICSSTHHDCTCTFHLLLQSLTDAVCLGPPLCHMCDRSWQLLQIDNCM